MAQQKITPHLWFDKEAKEAAEFYVAILPDSKITNIATLHNTPSGIVSFELWGQKFIAFSAGPMFKFTPAVSFMVNFDPLLFNGSAQEAREKLDQVWERLSEGGTVLMPLDKYPFSQRYGWLQDKYGLSWQLILTNPEGDPRPPILPFLMFVGHNVGRAEEASNFYLSVFKNSKMGVVHRYGPNQEPDQAGTLMFTDFMLEDCWFAATDSAHEHNFSFAEAVSFMVSCDTQKEIDDYWEKLSAVPEAEQCGWLKDKFGLSWQITPTAMNEMMSQGTPEQIDRLTQAFMPMKKLDIAKLNQAYEGHK